jgi:hypothetical protein
MLRRGPDDGIAISLAAMVSVRRAIVTLRSAGAPASFRASVSTAEVPLRPRRIVGRGEGDRLQRFLVFVSRPVSVRSRVVEL